MRDATESIWNNRTWGENVTVYFKDQKKNKKHAKQKLILSVISNFNFTQFQMNRERKKEYAPLISLPSNAY